MSPRAKKVTTGGLGARYGTSVRKRVAQIEREGKQNHQCPKCGNMAVQKVSVGVWRCRECENTYAGGAYIPTTKVGTVARRNIR